MSFCRVGFAFAMDLFMISLQEWDRAQLCKIYHSLTIQFMMMWLCALKKWSSQENQAKDIGLEKTYGYFIKHNNTFQNSIKFNYYYSYYVY
jgi:hypothetical protein